MSQQPLISIITISYNAASTIVRTVDSVRQQQSTLSGSSLSEVDKESRSGAPRRKIGTNLRFDDRLAEQTPQTQPREFTFEHILIDGASRDDTIQLARRHGVSGMRIFSEPDKGLYDAMNKGLQAARGEYVLFLNAGDKFHSPTTLAEYAAACSEGVDIVYGDTVLVDDLGGYVGPRHLSAPEALDADSFKRGMLVCHQAFMVRRELAPLYDLQYRFSADYDWCVKCLKATEPSRTRRLGVTIDYLTDGLTEKNKLTSLRERFAIMSAHFGLGTALWRHVGFVPRLLMRKIRRK